MAFAQAARTVSSHEIIRRRGIAHGQTVPSSPVREKHKIFELDEAGLMSWAGASYRRDG